MLTLQIVLICIASAMICAAIRTQRPEMAVGISLAASVAVILMLCRGYEDAEGIILKLRSLINTDEVLFENVFKAAGIAIVSEMGAQICLDAGEKTLAGRIALASRVAMLSMCVPMLEQIIACMDQLHF